MPRSSKRQAILDSAERAAERAQALEGALRRVADASATPEARAVQLVDAALGEVGATGAVTYRLTGDGQALEAVGATFDTADLPFGGRTIPLSANLPACEAVRTERVVRCTTREVLLHQYPVLRPVVERLGVGAAVAIPARHMGRVHGALVLTWDRPRALTAAEQLQLRVLSGRVARALVYARLYYAERAAHADADRARAEAEAARRAAEDANRAKDDFLAVVSHELRTPLQAILGFSELLDTEIAGPLAPRQHDYVRRVQAAGEQLLDTIENLLGFARAQAGMELAAAAPYDLAATARRVLEMATPLAERKGLVLRQTGAREGVVVTGDERKVRQILTNLVANAVKFTERGEITACVEAVENRVRIVVRDTGIGIAPEHLGRVFEPFVQVAGATTRTSGGTGLGLSIVRQLARLMGGEVEAESEVGRGSVFTVELPRG